MQTWAIVVGINKYPSRTGQKPLLGAVADACDFAEWALDPAGGNVAPDRLLFWTYPWPEETKGLLNTYLDGAPPEWYSSDGDNVRASPNRLRAPKAEEIVRTAEHAGNSVRDATFVDPGAERSRVMVFLAGHGLRAAVYGEDTKQTCFLAGDFRAEGSNLASGLVPCESLRRSLRNERFDEVLVFLDCCRTDPSTMSLKAQPLSDLTTDQQLQGWSVGHAAHEQGRAYETDNPPARGAFTKTLMDGLRGWRNPATQVLNVEQLEAYVSANIGVCTKLEQKPYFDFLPRDTPLVLVQGPPTIVLPLPVGPIVYLDALEEGKSLELLGENNTVIWTGGPYATGSPPVQIPPLTPAIYGLRVVGEPAREILFRHPGKDVLHVN